ncbi:universal stress protein [Tunicatimonas pelagia]|uniref:universal stress protein n=1 Tax=Tunicatimonas pelagia TaxID=931531 RepID=UPI002666B019|nr:universal stress protein [Tunicatimonas pelagia]WKN43669.1 universal stress protein [Tunicatimonas pelagia]
MKPIKHILAPTDFSNRATRALKYAISLAQATEAKLFILNAYPMTGVYLDIMASQEQVVNEVQERFQEIERVHLKDNKITYEFLDSGAFPEDAIEEAIKEQEIDLVVMGNRGDSNFEKLLGSTTFHLMTRTSCPILAIPENAVFSKVDSILFATDYQKIDRPKTFQGLISLADAFHAKIDVLHVSKSDGKLENNKLTVGDSLERALHSVRHSYHYQPGENVLEGLRAYLERHSEVGILAMMPRDHTIWERLTRGSITKQVVFETDRPVLVFHGHRS